MVSGRPRVSPSLEAVLKTAILYYILPYYYYLARFDRTENNCAQSISCNDAPVKKTFNPFKVYQIHSKFERINDLYFSKWILPKSFSKRCEKRLLSKRCFEMSRKNRVSMVYSFLKNTFLCFVYSGKAEKNRRSFVISKQQKYFLEVLMRKYNIFWWLDSCTNVMLTLWILSGSKKTRFHQNDAWLF